MGKYILIDDLYLGAHAYLLELHSTSFHFQWFVRCIGSCSGVDFSWSICILWLDRYEWFRVVFFLQVRVSILMRTAVAWSWWKLIWKNSFVIGIKIIEGVFFLLLNYVEESWYGYGYGFARIERISFLGDWKVDIKRLMLNDQPPWTYLSLLYLFSSFRKISIFHERFQKFENQLRLLKLNCGLCQ